MNGLRPWPPPTKTSNPVSPSFLLTLDQYRELSLAALSFSQPVIAILNFLVRKKILDEMWTIFLLFHTMVLDLLPHHSLFQRSDHRNISYTISEV